jgi:pyridoxamine 5'-phosphate oxidase
MSELRTTPLREEDVAADPLDQFRAWFEEAAAAVEVPEAMALATATPDGAPSARMVLLKRADERGFAFVSGYESRKGRELAANPRAALLFYWHPIGRQVRIEGRVERLPEAESDEYFAARPRQSRVSAVASAQSDVVPNRELLEARVEELAGTVVRRPHTWGGFVLVAHTYEFWQHRENRLHDRLRYRLEREGWVLERLAP